MEISQILFLIAALLTYHLDLPVASHAIIKGTQIRLNNSEHIDRNGYNSDKDGYVDQLSKEDCKIESCKNITASETLGVTAEDDPKRGNEANDPVPVAGYREREDFKPKAAEDRNKYDQTTVLTNKGNLSLISKPSGDVEGFVLKPLVSRGSGEYSVLVPEQEEQDSQPSVISTEHNQESAADRIEYDSKLPIRSNESGENVPKVKISRVEYDSKSAIKSSGSAENISSTVANREDDELKPVVGGYNPEIFVRRYNLHPIAGRNQKPVVKDGYKPLTSGRSGSDSRRSDDSARGYTSRPVHYNERISEGKKPTIEQGGRETKTYIPIPVQNKYKYILDPSEAFRDGYTPKEIGGTGRSGDNPKPSKKDGDSSKAGKGDAVSYRRKEGPNVSENNNKKDEDYYYDYYSEYDAKFGDNVGGKTTTVINSSSNNKTKDSDYDVVYSDYDVNDDENEGSTKPPVVDSSGNKNTKAGVESDAKDEDVAIEDIGGKEIPVVKDVCICVPYYLCKDGYIISNGVGIVDPRKGRDPDHGSSMGKNSEPQDCSPFHVCCTPLDSETVSSSTVKPYEHKCGVRNLGGIKLSSRVDGEAEFGEWPFQAIIFQEQEGGVSTFKCGAVLIDKYHVITVAHCVYPLYKLIDKVIVRLGEWDVSVLTEYLLHADYKVSKVLIHPEYDSSSLWNDIAILRLEEPVDFEPHIDTVCLPQRGEIFDGETCIVTGWGKESFSGSYSKVLKEVSLEVIDNDKCQQMLRKTRLGKFFKLHGGFLCAGGEYGLDSCTGDGGGPLVCYHPQDNSYTLAGIVSWGIECGQQDVPGVYMRIEKYLDWISNSTDVNLEDYRRKS